MKKLFFVTLLIQFNFIQSDYSVHPRADFVVNELVNSHDFDEKEVLDVLKNAKKQFIHISFILFSDSTSDTSGSVFDTFEISSAWPDLQAFLGLTLSFSGQVVGD